MTYDWEKKITADKMAEIDALLPDGIHLIGLAVENASTCEAALIKHPECPSGGVLMADVFKDIQGDAERFYSDAVRGIWDGA